MGLDGLDIIYRVERTFGIEFSADEYVFLMGTAGQLHQFVWQKMQGRQPITPDILGIQRKVLDAYKQLPHYRWWTLVPESLPFNWLFPTHGRDQAWEDFGRRLRCTLPALTENAGRSPTFPVCCYSFDRLVEWLAWNHPQIVPPCRDEGHCEPSPEQGQWTEQKAWEAVCKILTDALGVHGETVVPHAHLRRDLGME